MPHSSGMGWDGMGMLLQSGAQTDPHHCVGGHRAQSSDSGGSTWESRAPAAALGARSTHQVPRTRAGGLPMPWHRLAALQHQGFVCSSLRSKPFLLTEPTHSRAPGAGEEAGLCPPAHRQLLVAGQPPHHTGTTSGLCSRKSLCSSN